MKYLDVEQYTDEWKEKRSGIPTASNAHLFITPGGKPTSPDNKEKRKYLCRLVAERVLGHALPERFEGNEHTERGHELEPEARKAFTDLTGLKLKNGGFCTTDDGRYGFSPDGLNVTETAAVEIKVVAPWNHVWYMLDGPGDKYKAQVQFQFIVGEGKITKMHFWAYHPPPLAPVHIPSEPDEPYQRMLLTQLELFYADLEAAEAKVRGKGNLMELLREAVAES